MGQRKTMRLSTFSPLPVRTTTQHFSPAMDWIWLIDVCYDHTRPIVFSVYCILGMEERKESRYQER